MSFKRQHLCGRGRRGRTSRVRSVHRRPPLILTNQLLCAAPSTWLLVVALGLGSSTGLARLVGSFAPLDRRPRLAVVTVMGGLVAGQQVASRAADRKTKSARRFRLSPDRPYSRSVEPLGAPRACIGSRIFMAPQVAGEMVDSLVDALADVAYVIAGGGGGGGARGSIFGRGAFLPLVGVLAHGRSSGGRRRRRRACRGRGGGRGGRRQDGCEGREQERLGVGSGRGRADGGSIAENVDAVLRMLRLLVMVQVGTGHLRSRRVASEALRKFERCGGETFRSGGGGGGLHLTSASGRRAGACRVLRFGLGRF